MNIWLTSLSLRSSLAIPIIAFCLLLGSCSIEADQIVYGNDQCDFCQMNIVDHQHAAQYVTKKGKQFKFDAIECMVHKLEEVDENGLAMILVSDFGKSTMIDASSAAFLVSEEIKSPMGENLSAFTDESRAGDYTGEIYNWDELKSKMAKK